MKIKISFIIYILFGYNFIKTLSKNQESFTNGLRLKSIKCQADNQTMQVKYCFLKALSRKVVTFNIGVLLLIPFDKPYYLQIVIFYRYGTIFRQVIDTKRIEVCGLMNGIDTNPLIKLFVDMINNQAPNVLHKCPYTGDFDLKNFTFNTDIIDKNTMIFPQGVYRCDYFVFLNEASTLNLSAVGEIKSKLKESFG